MSHRIIDRVESDRVQIDCGDDRPNLTGDPGQGVDAGDLDPDRSIDLLPNEPSVIHQFVDLRPAKPKSGLRLADRHRQRAGGNGI